MAFEVKDSGERKTFSGGMVRDTSDGKINYSLVLDGPMFKRWAEHMTKGAEKYSARNWMLAEGEEEYARFKESALRHFLQWYWDESDEDHASAVFFNINGAEYTRERRTLLKSDAREYKMDYCDGEPIYAVAKTLDDIPEDSIKEKVGTYKLIKVQTFAIKRQLV